MDHLKFPQKPTTTAANDSRTRVPTPSPKSPTSGGGSERTPEVYMTGSRMSREDEDRLTRCPRAGALIGTHLYKQQCRIIPIRCKCWGCAYCRKKNLSCLQARILKGEPEKFLTLTSWPFAGETAEACYKRTRPAISRLFGELRRRYGAIEGVIILERTRKGYPHWHCLIRAPFIPQHVYSELWKRFSGAWIVDIREIKGKKDALVYATKYVFKAVDDKNGPRLGRLYSFTHGYSLDDRPSPKLKEYSWTRSRLTELEELTSWKAGWRAVRSEAGWDLYPVTEEARAQAERDRLGALQVQLWTRWEKEHARTG